MMRKLFVRVLTDTATGRVKGFEALQVPFDSVSLGAPEGGEFAVTDLGVCESAKDNTALASWLWANVEPHPLAFVHDDAPKVRVKPDAADAPTIHFAPCAVADIVAHCESRGRDGLPDAAKAALREMLAHREDVPLKTLAAIGFSFEELKQHPRVLAKRQALDMARIAAQQAAAAAEAEAAEAAKRQARIERRLNKGAV
jgi:hypothetical protein